LTVLKRILIDHWKMRETEAWLNMARLPMNNLAGTLSDRGKHALRRHPYRKQTIGGLAEGPG
jgi:hypothetical protein